MDHPQRTAHGEVSSIVNSSSSLMPNVLFREIHKNAYLKRHSSDRRTGFPRKSEKVWVVFCVHDDVEAFLEIYSDQKLALTHKPDWFASLSNALHVSPSICGHEDEFEFAVTLTSQVVRLAAPSWDSMMEWVETIRNKLRELKVLSPKENLYSKMPEQKLPLLPTRDPNSPLPLPPEGPSTLLPGVEPVHLDSRNLITSNDNEGQRHQRDVHNRSNINHSERRNNNAVNMNHHSVREIVSQTSEASEISTREPIPLPNHVESLSQSSSSEVASGRPRVHLNRAVSVPESPVPYSSSLATNSSAGGSNVTVIEVSSPNNRGSHSASECGYFSFTVCEDMNPRGDIDIEDVFFTPPVTPKPDVNIQCDASNSTSEAHYEHVFLSSTVFENRPSLNSSEIKINCNEANAVSEIKIGSESNCVNTSHEENQPCTSSSLMSTAEDGTKSIVIGNLSISNPCEVGKVDVSGCISVQTQSKLEKVNITGLIPRVTAKSSKHDLSKKIHHGHAKDLPHITSSSESKRPIQENGIVSNQQSIPSKDLSEGKKPFTSDEDSRNRGASSSNTPPYSQVKKSSKIKTSENNARSHEECSSQMLSPIPIRRRITEVSKIESESHSAKPKPDILPHVAGAKTHVIIDHSESVVVSSPPQKDVPKEFKKTKSGNINRNESFPPEDRNSPGHSVLGVSNNQYRNDTSNSVPSTSGNIRQESNTRINITKKEGINNHNNNVDVEPLTATVQPAVGVISVEDIPLIGGHQRRRRRSSSSDAANASNTPPTRGIGGADRIRINNPLTVALPLREPQRSESDRRPTADIRNESEQNSRVNLVSQNSARLTLREQQVLQLRKEMMHPGGVRLQLRRKDCIGSIALVDVLNGVWVAGWKQKEHPMLYNALHIGDQVISVADVVVRSSADAQKIIRSSSNLYIEFIIRRVPFGRVLALQRSSEGQTLGIIQEGNTAEIKDVVPNSIAARQGLTPKTKSCDGLTLTTWFLTEINGRPLNLFFKDNEVSVRLNAVGKEISILVQPNDFVKQIKKNLKSIRSYKDYIVQ